MPNIEILERLRESQVLEAIKSSNTRKVQREGIGDEVLEPTTRS